MGTSSLQAARRSECAGHQKSCEYVLSRAVSLLSMARELPIPTVVERVKSATRLRGKGKKDPLSSWHDSRVLVRSGSLEGLRTYLLVGIGTAEEDASNALLRIHFHEVTIFKGGGCVPSLGAVGALVECVWARRQ